MLLWAGGDFLEEARRELANTDANKAFKALELLASTKGCLKDSDHRRLEEIVKDLG